jgi:hypothetical protein
MDDLAESLIVEARVCQSWDAKVRFVKSGTPGPDPPVVVISLATIHFTGYGERGATVNHESSEE